MSEPIAPEPMSDERLKWFATTGGCDICDSNWTECVDEIRRLRTDREELFDEMRELHMKALKESAELRKDLENEKLLGAISHNFNPGAEQQEEINRLRKWVNDLHSGMYINCVYCGHRYGPNDEVPASMADVLKEHVERCPAHPMSKLREENERLKGEVKSLDARIGDFEKNWVLRDLDEAEK